MSHHRSQSSCFTIAVDRLDELKPEEKAACLIAERVLGVVAEAWDIKPRQGVVDAMLTYPDGRRAGFEVTVLADDGALQTGSLLARDSNRWPRPGQWAWTVDVGSPADLPRLKGCYARIALLCEAAGASRPLDLWTRQLDPDPDIAWLVEESASDMFGYPQAPAEGKEARDVMVVPAARGGTVDDGLVGLRSALEAAFQTPHMVRHLAKAGRAEPDERHLFIPVHWTALPFDVSDGLRGDTLPPDPPPLPATVTHLWLAPEFARRVLLWTPSGWQNHYPYDN